MTKVKKIPELKSQWNKIRREITPKIGQLTNNDQVINRIVCFPVHNLRLHRCSQRLTVQGNPCPLSIAPRHQQRRPQHGRALFVVQGHPSSGRGRGDRGKTQCHPLGTGHLLFRPEARTFPPSILRQTRPTDRRLADPLATPS